MSGRCNRANTETEGSDIGSWESPDKEQINSGGSGMRRSWPTPLRSLAGRRWRGGVRDQSTLYLPPLRLPLPPPALRSAQAFQTTLSFITTSRGFSFNRPTTPGQVDLCHRPVPAWQTS